MAATEGLNPTKGRESYAIEYNVNTVPGIGQLLSAIAFGATLLAYRYPLLPDFPPSGYPQPGEVAAGGGRAIEDLQQVVA